MPDSLVAIRMSQHAVDMGFLLALAIIGACVVGYATYRNTSKSSNER